MSRKIRRGFTLLAAHLWRLPEPPLTPKSWASAEPEARMAGFGGSLAIAGDQILVGEANNSITPGAVWVFTRAGDAWAQTGPRHDAPNAREAADGFGASISRGRLDDGSREPPRWPGLRI